jgi:hypothetical protein
VMIDSPIPADGQAWPVNRLADVTVAQTAYQLIYRQRLWLPGVPEPDAVSLTVCSLKTLSGVGPIDRDIDGIEYGSVIRGPFEIMDLDDGEPTYPALWAHDAKRERRLIVAPDSHATIRQGRSPEEGLMINTRAAKIAATASRCHFSRDLRFNSQSTSACLTLRPVIGGRAWPSVIFADQSHEKPFVLWANSTLGLLCYWWHANKQHSGRESITVTAIPHCSTYDFRSLTDDAKERAEALFDEIATRDLRAVNELDRDPTREIIDREFLSGVLGISPSIVATGGPLDLLRRKMAREPSIRGSKNNR